MAQAYETGSFILFETIAKQRPTAPEKNHPADLIKTNGRKTYIISKLT
jgi:hypothetical protein